MRRPPALIDPERDSAGRRRGPLRPTAPIGRDILLPDDPAIALALAQHLLVRPRMANHSFGLWGYSGEAKLGGELTVQSAGIGASSTASVVSDLAAHGAARIVRLGRCRALAPSLRTSEGLIVETALPWEGDGGGPGGSRALEPDRALAAALAEAAPGAGRAMILSVDSLLVGLGGTTAAGALPGVAAVDLETAALFALARRLGLAAAAVLVICEAAVGGALSDEDLAARMLELGDSAARALAAGAPQASASGTARRV